MPGIGNAIGIPFRRGGGAASPYAGWSKSGVITIDNTDGDEQTDYQVELTLTALNFDFASAKADGGDIRILDGETELSYFIDSFNQGTETGTVFIKLPTIPADDTKELTLYYGNVSAESQSSGDDTFDYFDDFTKYTGVKDYFTDNGIPHPLSALNLPPGAYYNGKTYIVYNGFRDDPYIITYTHATETLSLPVWIGTNPNIMDIHEQPCLLIDSTGYIHVFWGAHNSAIKYARSNNQEDISAFTARTDISNEASYPNVMQKSDGTIFLFYRRETSLDWGYQTSADTGTSWSAFTTVLDSKCYASATLGADDKIHVATPYTTGTGVYQRFDPHYLYLDTDDDWKNIDDDVLALPYSHSADTLVYNAPSNTLEARIQVNNGHPYMLFPLLDSTKPGWHKYIFVKHNGVSWDVIELTETTLAFQGVRPCLDIYSSTEFHSYIMVGTQLQRWKSVDTGTTWAFEKVILDDGEMHGDCQPIKNAQNNARVLIQDSAFDLPTNVFHRKKVYLYGDDEFIQRDITENQASDVIGSAGQYNNYSWKYKPGYAELYTNVKGHFNSIFPQDFTITSENFIIETDVEISNDAGMGLIANIQDVAGTYYAYAAFWRFSYNTPHILGVDLNAVYASWYKDPPGVVATGSATPSINTRYVMKLEKLTGGAMKYYYNGANFCSGSDATYTGGKMGLFFYIHTTAAFKIPCTAKFYYLRVRKNSLVVPTASII